MIKNPTPEEIQELLKKKSGKEVLSEPVKSEESKKNDFFTNVNASDETDLKPKKSKFEPDPLPCELVSRGRFYSPGRVWMRKMNTEEEARLASISSADSFNKTIDVILSTAVRSNFPITSLSMVDKLPLFTFLLSISYAKSFDIEVGCSLGCKRSISIEELEIEKIDENVHYPFEDDVQVSNGDSYHIRYRYPSIGDGAKNGDDVSDLLTNILINVESSSGEVLPKKDWREFVNWLSLPAKRIIGEKLDSFSSKGTFYLYDARCSREDCDFSGKIRVDSILLNLMEEIQKNGSKIL